MARALRLAVAGVGNNISGLLQGAYWYRGLQARGETELPGVRQNAIGGVGVGDIDFVCAFDADPRKIGQDLTDAVLAEPNNYPRLDVELPQQGAIVQLGLVNGGEVTVEDVTKALVDSDAEVLLYSLPTGLQWEAEQYAQAALGAGVAFVNCTPEVVARNPEILAAYEKANVPMVGDDLASHMGSSMVHRSLLSLFAERGVTMSSSYQLNFGGNEDFRNLRENGASKQKSKLNALAQKGIALDAVEIIPSAGYISHLKDNKVAVINIEGLGWAGTPVSLDLKLKVQDSSNAAGVIIDLIRVAAAWRRLGEAGFPIAAASCLKSPAVPHDALTTFAIDEALSMLNERVAAAADRS
ncbi:inositol-3-phosphate synthase [Actinoplanes sp. NPDC051475]|uniref:inositol-3-phosphate synthase n=1 Tax=Actinoplanes sp. NPDC051475 TaxID=3157225 RepID=UPI00344EAE34